jgi:hypothetical protein
MNAVRENPYRTLGLLANSTEKELQKQIATIKRYSEVGKAKSFDFDFPFLGEFKREESTVQEAASRIEQAKNKVHYSLFWFLNSNHIDEAALNHLKEANVDKAIEIWGKLIKDNSITAKNYSAALNLSTLQLGLTTLNGSFSHEEFQRSIELKGLIISSDAYLTFVQSVAGENTSVSKESILKDFADEILQIIKPYLNKSNGITSTQLLDAFKTFPTDIKQYLSGKFTDKPIGNIESQVEKAKESRTQNASDAEQYGAELYKSTKADLAFLKNVLGANNVQFKILSDKVTKEVLQCAIDFFIEYRDSEEYDPGDEALKLMKMAKAISPSGQVRTKVEENISRLEEWINDKPERDRNKNIKAELEFIGDKLERFQNLADTVANAKDLVISCKPKLDSMKRTLGATEEYYLKISNAIVGNAQGMLVTAVNEAQEEFQVEATSSRYIAINNLKNVIQSALEVTTMLGSFDMSSELRSRYNTNKSALQNIGNQLGVGSSRSSSSSSSSPSSSSGSGCYIATMAYGSYEHPKVLELRIFRDETLAYSRIGRWLIRTYYKVSPKLVELLKDKPAIHAAIRFSLNTFIRIMK